MHCAPGKRNEVRSQLTISLPSDLRYIQVFTQVAKVCEIALQEPEPLTLLICFPTPNPPQAPLQDNLMKEDIIYFFERFASAETRKSGTPKSTPAFYNLITELRTTEPPLLPEMPNINLFEQRHIRFQENVGDRSPVDMGRIFVRVTKKKTSAGATGGGKLEDQNRIVKKAEEIGASVGGVSGHIFDGVWITESEVWNLNCWAGEDGDTSAANDGNKDEAGEAFDMVMETGYVRKRVDPNGGFVHDIQML